ncbi:MAG: leucyl aminopeptidase, partial [Burkholderiales bacterium]|nr:leucyl aminopeptidase [Burkholderiales bacterium]
MDFSIKAFNTKNAIAEHKTGCVVVGVYENSKLSAQAKLLDSKGVVSTALKTGDITGKPGSTLLLHAAAGQAKRVLLVGLGPEAGMSDRNFISVAQAVARVLSSLGAADALVALPIDLIQGRDAQWGIRSLVLALRESVYRSDGLKSKKDDATNGVKRVVIGVDGSLQSQARTTLLQSVAMANGLDLSKTLGNLPPNICTPTYLANTAKQLAKEYKLNVEVLDRKQLEALKMGSFLSVTQGSEQPPKFIVLKHMGGKAKDAPVVLVGKGITFDTGGISLKPGSGMDEMKYDMCGAGSVLGTFRAIAEMQLKLNVIGVIPTCENMPSGRATRPGDIVTSMSGQTIEILNTDAEGRLILCDALTYVERFKPAAVVDIATL